MDTASEAAELQRPVDVRERITELDALRGVALGGIVLANARQLLLPWEIADYPLAISSPPWLAWLDWSVFHAFVDLKFLTLFSILFGIGFAVQNQRLKSRDAGFTAIYLRRVLILAAFGLAHGLLLYPAEVLLPYAIGGLMLLALGRLSPAVLIRVGLVLLGVSLIWGYQLGSTGTLSAVITLGSAFLLILVHVLLRNSSWSRVLMAWTAIVLGAGVLLTLPSGPAPPSAAEHEGYVAAQAQLSSMLQGNMAEAPEEFRVRVEGSFNSLLALHANQYALLLFFFALLLLWRTLGIFLIGIGIFRLGLLSGNLAALGGRLLRIGLGIGLPLTVLATALYAQDMLGVANRHWPALLHALSALPMAAGIAGLVFVLRQRGRTGFVWRRIDAVGRTALTNYVGQSFVLSCLAEQWGFGQYGRFDGPQITAIALVAYVALAELSCRWLARFGMGPLEWLWRCGTYGRWLPLRHPRPPVAP